MTGLALIFDTGCLVLIWLVQLIIYPSFQYYQQENLKIWHAKYTKWVTFVILPLMLGQLVLGLILVFSVEFIYILKLGLILSLWLITFVVFVPLHSKINTSGQTSETVKALIHKNWSRTSLWSLNFVLSVTDNFIL